MNGDTEDFKRGEALFQRLLLGDKLKNSISRIKEKDIDDATIVEKEIDKLLTQNALPLNTWWRWRFKSYIFGKEHPVPYSFQTPFVELINHEVSRTGSYNDIRLYEGATQKDVRTFISKNWKQTKPSYREGTKQRVRSQASQDKQIIEEINELSKLSRAELIKISRGESMEISTTKEIEISRIIKDRFGVDISDDAVKAKYYRAKSGNR